jgi:hypothetical protein
VSAQSVDDGWEKWYAAVSDESVATDFERAPESGAGETRRAPGDRAPAGRPGAPAAHAIRTEQARDPGARGRELADELGADLVDQPAAASRAVADRAAAARRLEADRTAAGALDPETVNRLRMLGGELARAERIRAQTEVVVADALARRLSTSTGVAVHPTSLRQSADSVAAADQRVAAAKAATEALGPRPDTVSTAAGMALPSMLPQIVDDDVLDARQTRMWAFGIALVLIAVPVTLLALGIAPWPAAVGGAVLAILVATVIVRRGAKRRADELDRRATTESLDLAAATAARAGVVAEASRDAVDEWIDTKAELDGALRRAEDGRRSARRAWEALAGPDADPYDLETVLHLHDSQYSITAVSLTASPAVRTAHAYHRRAQARWKVAWAANGRNEPPAPDDIDEALAALEATSNPSRDADSRVADVGLVARPLVLVDPYNGMDAGAAASMRADLKTLDGVAAVVVVERQPAAS